MAEEHPVSPRSTEADPGFALEFDGVSAGYGETVVIEDIVLRLKAGEAVSIIGRNGVGKTTLLATAMGHTTLHGGGIRLFGEDISKLAVHRRCRAGLGYVPQEREIFPSLTLAENLDVAARPGNRAARAVASTTAPAEPRDAARPRSWNKEAVFELFPRLAERRHHRGNQLSGGEQQMLSIARALIGNPGVLLMDEPSEGLAPVIVEELARAVARLADMDRLTLILVEQNTRLALAVSPRTLIMDRGRIVYDGESAVLKRDPQTLERMIGVGKR